MAEPEILREISDDPVDRKPFAGEGADNDDQQTEEEKPNPRSLKLRVASSEERRHVEAGRKPGDRNPQDCQLRVPGARDRIGEVFRQGQSVESLPLYRVMGGNDSQPDLRNE